MTIHQAERASIATLKSEVHALVECGKFGDALDAIRYFVESVINNQRSVGKVFASADLDRLCRYVGEVAANNAGVDSCSIERRGTVILATELVKAGGHVELIKDIIRLKLIDGPFSILLTDLFDRVDDDLIANFSVTYGVAVEVARCHSSIERLEWMLKRLCSLAPTTLVLLTHNQDSVGIAAAHSHVADKVVFIHHGDHHLSLGVTCEDFIHVDPHNIGFFHCKDTLGIKNNYYWPLTVNCDSLEPRSNSFLAEGHLVTCSSGRPEKFDASYYIYYYFELIPKLLGATSGRHIHIGSLTTDMEARLQHGLMAEGVDPARFIYIPWVPSLARALIEYNVDLYISSFPIGGGKASLEAMAAGVPLLMHQSYRSRFHGGVDLAYPDAWIWRTGAELVDIVSNMTVDDLTRHSLLARAHYDKFHSDQSLIDASDFSKIKDEDAVPKLRQYTADDLQVFLDETAEINTAQRIATSEFQSQLIKSEQSIAALQVQVQNLLTGNAWLTTLIDVWKKTVSERERSIVSLQAYVQDLLTGNAWLTSQCEAWENTVAERDKAWENTVAERDKAWENTVAERDTEINGIYISFSWRLTRPLRFFERLIRDPKSLFAGFHKSDSPSDALPGTPSDTPSDMLPGTPSDTPSDILPGTPSDTPSDVLPGTPSDTPSDALSGAPSDTPYNVEALNLGVNSKILLVVHEFSRTGAPYAVLYLAQALFSLYGVRPAVISPQDGPIREEFEREGFPTIVDPLLFSYQDYSSEACDFMANFERVIVSSLGSFGFIRYFTGIAKHLTWWIHETDEGFTTVANMVTDLHLLFAACESIWLCSPLCFPSALRYASEDKLHLLLYGCADKAAPHRPHKSGKIVFSIVGSIVPRKGQDTYLAAIERLPEELRGKAVFRIIGSPLPYKESAIFCEEVLTKAALLPEVECIESMPQDRLLEFYAETNVLVSASRDDPMPIVVTEGLMFSKVCLCSSSIGHAQLLEDGKDGLIFTNKSAEELSEKMAWLLQNPTELTVLGKAGREIYEKYFLMSSFVENVGKLIQNFR